MQAPTSMSDLPHELSLMVARYVTVPTTYHDATSMGYLNVPDLHDSFSTMGRRNRRLFFDIISKEYLHIKILACGCALDWQRNPWYAKLLEELNSTFNVGRRVPDIHAYEQSSGLILSLLGMELMCDRGCMHRRRVEIRTFLATRETMLTLYGILSRRLPIPLILRVETRLHPGAHVQTSRLLRKILDQMREILFETIVVPTSRLRNGYDLNALSIDLFRGLQFPRDLVRLRESHLCAIQEALDHGVALDQLMTSLLSYESSTQRTHPLSFSRLPEIANWFAARRYLFELEITYATAVLQGLASYLLSRPMTVQEQTHFMMSYPPTFGSDIGTFLTKVDFVLRCYWEWEEDNPNNMPVTMGWIAPIYKARVELLLAWARLNTVGDWAINDVDDLAGIDIGDFYVMGDNEFEEYDFSTWGSPKSNLLVARKDMARILGWSLNQQLTPDPAAKEGAHPMDVDQNIEWSWKMQIIADAIYEAQPRKGHDPTNARIILEPAIIQEPLCKKLMLLPDLVGRTAVRTLLEWQNYFMG